MKIKHLVFSVIMLFTLQSWCNNVQVSNVRLTGQDTTNNFTMVEFDISWENSWRYSNGPANWDAAWIFVKYKIGPGPWMHAWLNNTGHQSCTATTIENGLLTPGAAFNITTNPALGVFLYRSSAGSGTFSCQDVQLRWNYGANDVADNAQVDIKVFAIEHVYIPEGPFTVGSGGNETGRFVTSPYVHVPYTISSEALINVGLTADYLYYDNSIGYAGDQAGPIPAAYPKGFKAFYAMKYEISQQGYVDFLNTLTRGQQVTRVRSNIYGEQVTERFVMAYTNYPVVRNGISCRPTIPPFPAQIEFFCDLNNNNTPNESNDGQNIPCNLLKYADMGAYLDWAGLRLMTEFEFEKCGRGKLPAYVDEYAWGDDIYYVHTGLLNEGTSSEIPIDYAANNAGPFSDGPLRTGAFARATSNRTQSGAGYYGCLELSGSLEERGVTVGNPAGRGYTGVHGDGELLNTGELDVSTWPSPVSADGAFLRGGSYLDTTVLKRLSERGLAAYTQPISLSTYGGRGVRTAE